MNTSKKDKVHDFWNDASCGEELYLQSHDKDGFNMQSNKRYELEPYILDFADFNRAKDKKVLEIGVGLGADHQKFAESGAIMTGIDLTSRAIENTKARLKLLGLESSLLVGDAENLQFKDNSFDEVYSWGVIHHSPNTSKAVSEIFRVLAQGGEAKIMIYHKWSLIGLMLWLRYALLRFRPFTSLEYIYSEYLESPGTKAYSKKEAKELFCNFSQVNIQTVLTHGDLLESDAGQRHKGIFIDIARKLWPRSLIKKILPNAGLFMLIKAIK
jgi:ubiquinone/menaquinone biosynthesis C-methylase UbiE